MRKRQGGHRKVAVLAEEILLPAAVEARLAVEVLPVTVLPAVEAHLLESIPQGVEIHPQEVILPATVPTAAETLLPTVVETLPQTATAPAAVEALPQIAVPKAAVLQALLWETAYPMDRQS